MAKAKRKRRTAKKGKPGVQMRGYERIVNFVEIFEAQVVDIAAEELEAAAKRYSAEVRGIIRNQSYNHVPLNQAYLESKKKKGLDPRILIATADYVNKIKAKRVKGAGKEVSYRVGPPMGIHKPSGLPYKTLARIHEFGSDDGRIPARPVWRPSWSAFVRREGKKVVRTVKAKAAARVLRNALRGGK